MKKLMIAMGAAAMMSLCANADALLGGVDFETGYSAGDPIATTSTDPGSESDLIFWAGSNGDSVVAEEETATAGVSNKFLKVDTTDVLVRQTAVLNASEVTPVDIGDGDITVSAKVQFTAADEAPEASAGDKLIVWAKAPDEDAQEGTKPTLCVTDGTATQENPYIDTLVEIEPDRWYSLEIKAVKDGSGLTKTAVFELYLDGTKVGNTYKSLVTGGDAAQTIASIGFKGTGAVDDIAFAKNAAVVVPDVTVTVTCTDGYTVYTNEAATVEYSAPIVVKAGASVTVYVGDDVGDLTVTSTTGTVGAYDGDNCIWPVTYVTDAQHTAVTLDITVEADDGKTAITENDVTLSYEQATYYDGITFPTVTVTVNETRLTENTDYTVNWVPAEITAEGGTFTVTVAGIGNNYKGSVVKTVTVTPAGGETAKVGDTEYTTGADFVAAATSGTVNTLPSTWTVEGNTVKDGTGATFATFPEFYTVSLTGTTLTLELNNKALETVGTMTAVTVGTNFGLSVSASNVKLYYGLASCATVNGTYAAPAKAGFTQGTGSALTLNAAKGVGSACFYKLYVTDVLPNE